METAYLALGTNLGNKVNNLNKAVQEINKRVGKVISLSAYYVSAPWGFESDNSFINAVLKVETSLDALNLLQATQQIEVDLGRKTKDRKSVV